MSGELQDLAHAGTAAVRESTGLRAGPSQWRGEVKKVGDLAANEIALWRHLTATHHALRSPYFSFEFSQAVAEAGARARVCLLYEKRTLAGFFPFQFADMFAQSMASGERIGGELNDFCGVLIDQPRHGAIGAQDLLQCAGLASFEVSHLEETQPGLGLRASVRSQGARVRLENGIEGYWEAVKSGHPGYHHNLRRKERKIQREFDVVDFVFAPHESGEILRMIVAEKRKQYERTGAADGFAKPWTLRCLERIARYQEGRCVPVLSTLYFDGEWAALDLSLRAGELIHSCLTVYNTKFHEFSPGLILTANMIRESVGRGIREIDLGEGLSHIKELFATEFYPVYRDVWYRASPRGLGYRGYLSLSWRAKSLLRRWPTMSNAR